MKFLSVCSGIEAASVAWEPLGWSPVGFAEIEAFPKAVLEHHYPSVINYGDMTALPDLIKHGLVDLPDLLCGGTPCQAFSVAGQRRSLDDARGNLSLTFCEIANAIDTERAAAGLCAGIIFWENVPGVLSTKDNAFGCFLAELAGEDAPLVPAGGKWANAGCVSGPKRTIAWRILDAQYFGVAQRRRRVFVVASARDGFDPTAVLFEFDGLRRDSAPSREAGKEVATGSGSGATFSCGGIGAYTADSAAATLLKSGQDLGNGCEALVTTETAECLTAGGNMRYDYETEDFVMHPISIHPHCIGRAPNAGPQGKEYLMDGSAYCMDSRGQPQAVAHQTVVHGTQDPCVSGGLAFSLGRNNGGENAVMQPMPINTMIALRHEALGERTGFGIGEAGDPAYTLTKGHSHAVAQPFGGMSPVAGTLTANTGGMSRPAGNANELDFCVPMGQMAVRRLTPVECERLQGFPDNYTAIPWRKKPASECPDSPRYKALGNSWAVPVVRWIGKRIDLHLIGLL